MQPTSTVAPMAQMQPCFRFFDLPPEVQLSIIDESDPISTLRLIRLSPYLESLVLGKAKQTIPKILANIPSGLEKLRRIWWCFDQMDKVEFSLDKLDHVLEQKGATNQWETTHSRLLQGGEQSIALLIDVLEAHEEIDVTVQLYTKTMGKLTTAVLGLPLSRWYPEISTSEYEKVSCALWMLKIYYQLQSKLAEQRRRWDLIPVFRTHFSKWELEQAVTMELFFHVVNYSFDHSIYGLVHPSTFSREAWIMEAQYLRQYFNAIDSKIESPCHYTTRMSWWELTPYTEALRTSRSLIPHEVTWLPQEMSNSFIKARAGDHRNERLSTITNHSIGDAWITQYLDLSNVGRWVFTELGMCFWDRQRFNRLGLLEPSNLSSVFLTDLFMNLETNPPRPPPRRNVPFRFW